MKRSNPIKKNRNRKPNPMTGTTTTCIPFEALSYFQCFRSLPNATNFWKHKPLFDKFSFQTNLRTGVVNTLGDLSSTSRGIDPGVSKYRITNVEFIWYNIHVYIYIYKTSLTSFLDNRNHTVWKYRIQSTNWSPLSSIV